MALKRMDRSYRTEPGWRLATVEEAKDNLESIKHNNLLGEWDRARLLDGWIGGAGYDFYVQVGFRSCLGYMLVIESTTPDIINTDDRNEVLYSKVALTKEGRSAALFLCCEDWNYEVLHWLIQGRKEEGCTSGVAISVGRETKATSEQVSAMARELQGVRAKSRVPKPEFSCASMTALTDGIQNSAKSRINIQEYGSRIILSKALLRTELMDIGDQCWKEMGLTEDLKRFQEFEFDTSEPSTWEAVADTVWYAAAEAMAVVIVTECCAIHNQLVMDPVPLAERKRMDDRAFIESLIAYACELLHTTFLGYESLWKIVKAAATEATGDCKRFNEILRDRGYGTLSYGGNYDVNTFLFQAAKKGDVNLIERLIESGVQPTEIDAKKKTVLHHAAKLDDESKGLEIAEMLLTEKSLANAVDYKRRTALHRAASCGHARMCRLLRRHKASVTYKDENGQTPLHHALLGEERIEEVVRVLISAEGEDTVQESARLVDVEDQNGLTPLELAVIFHNTNVRMVVLLLSLSGQRQSYFEMLPLSCYLRESSRMGYKDLVQELVNEKADPLDPDDEGKTTLHYAAEGAEDTVALEIIKGILSPENQEVNNLKSKAVSARDKYGRNVLHIAAFLGHKKLCEWLLKQIPNIDTKDHDGQSAIYYAVAGAHDDSEVLDEFISRAQGTTQDFMKDDSQTTPLHVAAGRGNLKMVEKLLSKRVISGEKRKAYVGAADVLGQTALHKAASGGYKRIVKKLLDEGANPLEERDSDGKTALHHAAQAENEEDAVAIAKLLMDKCESDKHRSLLLFASAVGIGSAEKSLSSSSLLKDYLVSQKSEMLKNTGEENLLTVAAKLGNIDMTRELLTRGANIAVIRNEKWRDELTKPEKGNVEDVLKQINNLLEQGTDKPALWDSLGRSAYANGLAALFLNPFVKSPITVGISGEWGMGKSSLMVQTERILIQTAAQLAFSNSFQKEDFPGASESKLSAEGEARRRKITNSLERLLTTKSREKESKPVEEQLGAEEVRKFTIIRKIGMFIKRVLGNGKSFTAKVIKNIVRDGVLALRALWSALQALWIESAPLTSETLRKFNEFLAHYEPKYHQILKSVAVMDRRDMFEDEVESGSRNQRLGGMPWEEDSMQRTTPSVLTVRYNAWQYRNESEAWAGLAVEITKELEATMTVAQKLRTSWRYNWITRRNSICFGVILPCFLAVLVAIWFTTIVWLIFDRAQNKDIQGFKYGGLPASVIVAAWGVGKSTMSVVKPISSQVVDYICLPDHSQKLGYHRKVIFDINFLKDELCYRPPWMWKVFAFLWCCITFSWDDNYVPGTMIRKMPPAFKDNLRMVVFVDDLDRCQENVILQILSAVNLVLATCEINVILGMDKSMIERAIRRKFGDKNSKPNKSNQDLADKYLRKIIQLPLDLPDPSNSEYEQFLQGQLGMSDSRKGVTHSEAQRERPNTHGHRKVNPKFQMGTSVPMKTKLARGETIKSPAETGAKQERARSISDTVQNGFQKMKREETIGKPGSGVEETKTENCLQWCKFRVKNIVRGGKNSLQTLWNALHPLLNESATYVCQNLRHFNERSKMEKSDTSDIEQSIESSEQAAGENNQNAGFQKQAEDSDSKQKLMDLYPITTEMLIPRYSEGEKEVFRSLHTRSARSRRLPRDWKCLLTYHRLAWNILSKSPEVIPLAGWQVQLIAWVFVCWQWKHLITTLVQNWHELRVLRKWIKIYDIQKGEVIGENSGPSLREIVEHYIDEKWPADKKSDILQGDNAKQKNEDTIDNVNEKVCVNCCSSTEEVEKTSGNLPEKNMRAISSEDTKGEDYVKADLRKVLKEEREQKRGHFLKIKGLQRSKKGKRKHVEQDDLEGGLKLAIKKVLQEEDVKDMLKVIIMEAFKEEKEREKQPRDVSTSYEEDSKRESSLQQGITVNENQKASHKARKNSENKAKDEEREEWIKLKETLSRYNVSMDGIQAFQKFRFYCEPGHLPWPLTNQV